MSHDSRWLTYAATDETKPVSAIWLYNVETDEQHQVTSAVFNDTGPVFDRKGDYIYFSSARQFSPTYSDLDTSFVYNQSEVLLAVPLRKDVENPWLPKSDEETWDDEDQDDADEDAETDADDADADEADDEEESEPVDDGVSGIWEGTMSGADMPPDTEFSMTLWLDSDGTVRGHIAIPMGTGEIEGTYDEASGIVEGTITTEQGDTFDFRMTITGESFTMTASFGGMDVELTGTRTTIGVDDETKAEAGEDEPVEIVEIDIEDFERRAIQLPIPSGNFGQLAVNNKNQLIYARFSQDGLPEIMLFDITDDKKKQKTVAKGVGGFEISADGKKLITLRDNGASIQNAAAGATGKNVVTRGMFTTIEPREEWEQMFVEAWRLERDFLYVDNMHGVDWPAVREQYSKMLSDCATRDDLSFVIREMISEINIGHAYYFGGDVEDQPSVSVGMLGVNWELADGAYRIKDICEGAAWDVDARNPLRSPGIDVAEGEYLLAVNGVEVDTARSPWAAFQGMAGQTITITVSESPVLDENARDVVIEPMGSEGNLRYRQWIEANRAYVDEQTDGQVGYIYVPDTGVNGQTNLVRQYFGQIDKKALIIDERWNGADRSRRGSSSCSTGPSPITGPDATPRTSSGRPTRTTGRSACSSTGWPDPAATCSRSCSSRRGSAP